MNLSERSEAAGSVACGVTFLDDIMPDWRAKVDLELLDMSDPNCCVIGQVFDEPDAEPYPISGSAWWRGTAALRDWVEAHGYNELEDSPAVEFGFEHDRGRQSYDELQELWAAELQR